jgi:hypothetical protein
MDTGRLVLATETAWTVQLLVIELVYYYLQAHVTEQPGLPSRYLRQYANRAPEFTVETVITLMPFIAKMLYQHKKKGDTPKLLIRQ